MRVVLRKAKFVFRERRGFETRWGDGDGSHDEEAGYDKRRVRRTAEVRGTGTDNG